MKISKRFLPETGTIFRRPRLTAIIRRAAQHALVVMAAPAGYGKTTALADFLSSRHDRLRIAWLTLTGADNHPERFLRSLKRALAAVYVRLPDSLEAGHPTPNDLLQAIAAAVESTSERAPLCLVLDDFHLLTAPSLLNCVEALVDMRLPSFKIFLVSRQMPPFRLTNLALKGTMGVVTQEDLRFTDNEVRGWLKSRLIHLSNKQLQDLINQTDGWISGLYLNTVSLARPDDSDHVLRTLGTNSDALLDEEIFSRHDDEVRDFLLCVAPLNEYPLSLCIAVSGRRDASILLERASKSNLFIRPVGEEEYAIHHIFQGFLENKLKAMSPARYEEILGIAGDWYVEAGDAQAAAKCYMRGRQYEKLIRTIAILLEKTGGVGPVLDAFKREEFVLTLQYIESVPAEVLRRTAPLLEIYQIGILLILQEHVKWREKAEELKTVYESIPPSETRNRILGELEMITAYAANKPVRERSQAFERAFAYIKGPSILTRPGTPVLLGSPSILYLYYRENRELNAIAADYAEHWKRFHSLLSGIMSGMGDILLGEIAYERRNTSLAKRYVQAGLATDPLHDVKIAGYFILLRIALLEGDVEACCANIDAINRLAHEGNKTALYTAFDLCRAYWTAALRHPDGIPAWLVDGTLDGGHLLGQTVGPKIELLYHAFCLMANGRYDRLAALLPEMRTCYEGASSQLGLLYVTIYETIAQYANGDMEKAEKTLRSAWQDSAAEQLLMPFVERSSGLHPVIQTLLRKRRNGGEKSDFDNWLETLDDAMKHWNRNILRIKKQLALRESQDASALSQRERQVQALIQKGVVQEKICESLSITEGNLKVIISRLNAKLKKTAEGTSIIKKQLL